MIGLADENGKTYECKYGTYNVNDRFMPNENVEPIVKEKGWREIVNILFHEDCWKLKQDPIKQMTMAEIEEALGHRVQIIEPKKEDDTKHREKVDDTINFLRNFLGIDLDAEDYY